MLILLYTPFENSTTRIAIVFEAGINRLIEGSEGAPRLHKQTVARRRRPPPATSRTAVNL